jgi:hypothetical protein
VILDRMAHRYGQRPSVIVGIDAADGLPAAWAAALIDTAAYESGLRADQDRAADHVALKTPVLPFYVVRLT